MRKLFLLVGVSLVTLGAFGQDGATIDPGVMVQNDGSVAAVTTNATLPTTTTDMAVTETGAVKMPRGVDYEPYDTSFEFNITDAFG